MKDELTFTSNVYDSKNNVIDMSKEYKDETQFVSVPSVWGYDEDTYKLVDNNNLTRWLVGQRSYFYTFRKKMNGKYYSFFKKSPLLSELLTIYEIEKPSTYVQKNTQKAE